MAGIVSGEPRDDDAAAEGFAQQFTQNVVAAVETAEDGHTDSWWRVGTVAERGLVWGELGLIP